jgi:hypothetical protein
MGIFLYNYHYVTSICFLIVFICRQEVNNYAWLSRQRRKMLNPFTRDNNTNLLVTWRSVVVVVVVVSTCQSKHFIYGS